MADEKKPTDEEQKPIEANPEQDKPKPPEEKPEETPDEEPKAEDKSSEKENQEPPAEEPQEPEKDEEPVPPEMTREQELEAENFQLKTQIEAMKIGFNPDVIEDAVVLAENIVKRDGSDITAALQAVAKKYPDWKADSKDKDGKSKGGFKVGADTSKQKSTSEDKLNKAFGIKK